MAAERKRTVRCAIYTRKSSEEGLEQSFNSLDAQREACLAYVESQRHEGWKALPELYDDGGFSGGTMERPALKALLAAIDAGKVDSVVVYKVDRLTRSLADFAKIVELFDARGVSFVSVTQHFNTTSSMGRLTLNVLLSFAQFEREVTGERIRDKIAASKRKGMWMGGLVPLGYDIKDRKLRKNPIEAALVERIFSRYLKLGSVAVLKAELDQEGVRSKVRVNAAGKTSGGERFARGALYHLLSNRHYRGEIVHKGTAHPGEHEAIIPLDLWEPVQALLAQNTVERQVRSKAASPSLLAGLIFDDRGNRMTPSHAVKSGRRYRYYVSQAVIHQKHARIGATRRIPAKDIEGLITRKLRELLRSDRDVLDYIGEPSDESLITRQLIKAASEIAGHWDSLELGPLRIWLCSSLSKIVVADGAIALHLHRAGLRTALLHGPGSARLATATSMGDADEHVITLPAAFRQVRGEMRLVIEGEAEVARPTPNGALIKVIARGYSWYEMLVSGEITSLRELARKLRLNDSYITRVLRASLLAPDLLELILQGRQPETLTVEHLLHELPSHWEEQREFFASLG